MAGTLIQSIINDARVTLLEANTVPHSFWQDSELYNIFVRGCHDLWGAILDIHGEHFLTINVTTVVMNANATQLDGVPNDCFRVYQIEPRDTTQMGTSRGFLFLPRKYNSPDFTNARTRTALDIGRVDSIFYSVSNVGTPIAAPTILIAPQVTATVPLRLAYNPAITVEGLAGGMNPIPGESDLALIAWIIAFARAKEREDRLPDPGWLSTYQQEREAMLVRMTPRQEQEPDTAEGMFDAYGNY